MTVGDKIKKIKEEKGLTYREISQAIGVYPQTVMSLTTTQGRYLTAIYRFCKTYGVTFEELLEGCDGFPYK